MCIRDRLRSGTDPLPYPKLDFEIEAATDAISKGVSLQNDLVNKVVGRDAGFAPNDQLVLRVFKGNNELTKLIFDVVSTPLLPSNPSAFAHLQMQILPKDGTDADLTISAPLYANGPKPTTVELVDPRDLLDGIVRRRAIYQWRSFAGRAGTYRHALQKRAGSGATWIEPDLAEGWMVVGSEEA